MSGWSWSCSSGADHSRWHHDWGWHNPGWSWKDGTWDDTSYHRGYSGNGAMEAIEARDCDGGQGSKGKWKGKSTTRFQRRTPAAKQKRALRGVLKRRLYRKMQKGVADNDVSWSDDSSSRSLLSPADSDQDGRPSSSKAKAKPVTNKKRAAPPAKCEVKAKGSKKRSAPPGSKADQRAAPPLRSKKKASRRTKQTPDNGGDDADDCSWEFVNTSSPSTASTSSDDESS